MIPRMARKRPQPRPATETIAAQDLIVLFEERARQAGDAPLTAEEFARIGGELEVARRLAWLKQQRETDPEADDVA